MKLPLSRFAAKTKYTLHQRAYVHRTLLHDLIMVYFAPNLSDLFLHFFQSLVHIELNLSFPNDSYTEAICFGFPKNILDGR